MKNSHMAIGLIDRQIDQFVATKLEEAFYEGAILHGVEATIPTRWGGEALRGVKTAEKLAVFIRQNIFRPDTLEHLSIIAEPRFLGRIEKGTEVSSLKDALSRLLDLQVSVTIIPELVQDVESLRDIIAEALKK